MARGYSSKYFGENELSPVLIKLSFLPTRSHPIGFQPNGLRSSTQLTRAFNLLMGRSHSFRVCSIRQFRPIQTRFPWASIRKILTKPHTTTRLDHYAKGTPSPSKKIGLRPLVSTRFQVHIPPLVGFFSPFLTLLVYYRSIKSNLALTGWSPSIQSRFHVTGPTQYLQERLNFRLRLSPALAGLSKPFC